MRDVGRHNVDGSLRIVTPPSVWPAAGDASHPNEFPAVPRGSGLPDGGTAAARSPLSPAAALYAVGLGWPVSLQADEVVIECGEVLDVMSMPVGLAGEVNHLLKLHRLQAPIMEVPGTGRTWAFFCEPRRLPDGERAMAMLAVHRVIHFGGGARVPLPPSPTCDGAALRWIVPPPLGAPDPLPPWAALASCALIAVRR